MVKDDTLGGKAVEGGRLDPPIAVATEVAGVQAADDDDENFHIRRFYGPAPGAHTPFGDPRPSLTGAFAPSTKPGWTVMPARPGL
jgi:hypothetical protein